MLRLVSILFIICLVTMNCTKNKVTTIEGLLQYINDEKHGLLKYKENSNYKFSLKYLPVEYLVYSELMNNSVLGQNNYDSIISYYNNNYTFLFTITDVSKQPDREAFISSATKVDMNFRKSFKLCIDNDSTEPVLGTMEYSGGLKEGISYYLVFPKHSHVSTKELTVRFLDNEFINDVLDFSIKQRDISAIPLLKL